MTVIRSHRKDSMVGTIGPQATRVDDAGAYSWQDYRESAARASEHPWLTLRLMRLRVGSAARPPLAPVQRVSPYRVDTLATTELRFQARQATVRRMISAGDLDPYDGLALVVWPTAALLDAETGLTASICYQRARQDAA